LALALVTLLRFLEAFPFCEMGKEEDWYWYGTSSCVIATVEE
jgi:hypothetical protein